MILVSVLVADPAAQIADLGAGALLRIERAATQAGAYAEFATVQLNAGVTVYDVWDPSGSETTWYRTLFSEADGTSPTAESAPFQAGEQAYASRTDLLLSYRQNITDQRFLDRASQVLADVTRDLTREVGYSFFRSPLAGTETVTFDGNGRRLLHVHGTAPRVGIVSLSALEYRDTVDGTWTAIPSDEYRLEGSPGSTGVEPGDPYFHVALLRHGVTRSTYPKGDQLVRLTGVFGWPAIQNDHREAAIAWARQRLAGDPAIQGGQMGPDEMGGPFISDRHPRTVYDLVQKERERHVCWI